MRFVFTPSAEATAKALGESGYEALAVVTDVSQPEATERMAQATIDRFGRIDGLINNDEWRGTRR